LNPRLPPKLEDIVFKALEKDRGLRYQHAAEILTDLKRMKRDTDSGHASVQAASPTLGLSASEKAEAGPLRGSPSPAGRGWSRDVGPGEGVRRWPLALAGLLAVIAASSLLWFVARPSPPPLQPEPKPRRLTANPVGNPATDAHISPDGKYLAYADGQGIHLQVIDTGETRTIPQPQGVGYEVTDWFPVGWFPDGTKLLAQATSLDAEHSSVWMISLLGGAPREIRKGVLAGSVSPDGSLIAYTSTFFNSAEWNTFFNSDIWVMKSNGDEPRKIATVAEDEFLFSMIWAPDSRRIAYERFTPGPAGPLGLRAGIESRDLKGGEPVVVLSDPNLAPRFGGGFWWLADGRLIYPFGEISGRSSETDTNLWGIKVDPRTGRPSGKPMQITNWSGFSLAGPNASADGKRLVFGRLIEQTDVYVGELEKGGARLKAPPRRLTLDERDDWPTAWIPNSNAILFDSDRSGTEAIYKQALDQDSAELLVSTSEVNRGAILSPDGAWIIYQSTKPEDDVGGRSAESQLRRVPISGGPSLLVLAAHGFDGHQCARAPATLCLMTEHTDDQRELVLTAYDPVKGRGREVARMATKPGFRYMWNLSPDGSEIAMLFPEGQNRIRLLPVGGGQPHDLVIKGWSSLNSPAWAADSKGLYIASVTPRGATLLYIDLKGHANPVWEQRVDLWACYGFPSPDGRYLAILGNTTDGNVWMLENF
jgi:Tol biopolymer transport system component